MDKKNIIQSKEPLNTKTKLNVNSTPVKKRITSTKVTRAEIKNVNFHN